MRRWTDEEIARLRKLAQRRRATQIAIELGRSTGEVHRKARSLGISLRILTEDTLHRGPKSSQ
ncbi:hypothetical protein UP06_32805 [Bradyrhizobium sp. LTSP857]|nr:hypothetical protein UP06_32805 [Bradyrhizobium sp. LTSP857]